MTVFSPTHKIQNLNLREQQWGFLNKQGNKEFLRLQVAGYLTPHSVHNILKSQTKGYLFKMVLSHH